MVDELGREVGERGGRRDPRAVGDVGIFRNAQGRENCSTGWVNSGDLAYIAGGDVFITGRLKDIIIRAGRNIYPHEVESAVGDLPGRAQGRRRRLWRH